MTKRGNGAAGQTPLAGFPHHALDTYLPKLLKAGHRVAICEQLEDLKFAKGIVKRDVIGVVTPGVAFSDKVLEQKANNYLAAIALPSPPADGNCRVRRNDSAQRAACRDARLFCGARRRSGRIRVRVPDCR